jgi:predicted nucleic acid-binding protein
MSKIIDVRNYEPGPNDRIFFDCNIWIMLLGDVANYLERDQKIYSIFLNKLISRGVKIAINSLLVSEYSNRLLRIGFKQWSEEVRKPSADYKRDYLKTDHFKSRVDFVELTIKKMIRLSDRFNDEFNSINIDLVLDNFGIDMDFNDAYFLQFAKMKGYKIVTRDKDFIKIENAGVDIISDIQ